METGFVSAYERAIADPDIGDVESYISFLKLETEINPGMYHITEDTSEFAQQVEHARMLETLGDDYVNRVRPGMKAALKAVESLRNSPNEQDVFEVWNPDTIPLHIYAKMRRDPDIKFNTLLLKGWISSLKYSIDCDDEAVRRVVDRAIARIYTQAIRGMLTSIAYGFAFGEKVWQRQIEDMSDPPPDEDDPDDRFVLQRNVVSLRKVKFIDPRADVKFFKNKRDELDHVTQNQFPKEVKVMRPKLVWFTLDDEFDCLFGESRYKGIYNEWFQGNVTLQQLNRHVHRTGSPPLKIRYQNGMIWDPSTQSNILGVEIAKAMAKAYLSQGLILLPSERDQDGNFLWDMEFDKIENTDTAPFTNVLDVLTARKAKGIGVPPSLATGAANLGDANTQTEALIIVVEDLVDQLESVFQSDIVDQVVDYNFGPQYVSRVKFSIEKSGLGRRKVFKEIFVNVLRTMMSKDGFEPANYPDIVEMGEELGIPMKRLSKQVVRVKSDNEGDTPAADAQADEDSNGERHRPNPTERDSQSKTPSNPDTGDE